MTITFRDFHAFTVWLSMAEAMEQSLTEGADESRDDLDSQSRAAAMVRLADHFRAIDCEGAVFPMLAEIPHRLTQTARDVLENCLDNSSGAKPGDEDSDDCIFDGDVTIEIIEGRATLDLN